MTNTTSPEFILTQYNLSHNPETGKRMYRRQVLLLINRLKKEKFSDNDVLDWLLYFDTLPSPVAQLAACKWMCDATIILPEDEKQGFLHTLINIIMRHQRGKNASLIWSIKGSPSLKTMEIKYYRLSR